MTTSGALISPLIPYTTLFRSTIHSPASSQPSGHLSLEQFAEAAKGNESVYLSISGQSMQVLGMGTTPGGRAVAWVADRKSTRLNSSHVRSSYPVFCLNKEQAR